MIPNTVLDQINLQSCLEQEAAAASEFSNFKEKYVIDGSIDYPDPEYLIQIGGVGTLPKGNLVAVSAKWKNGKTFFCDILSAIFLGSDIYAHCGNLLEHGKVSFFDTEQAKNDTARILKTIWAITPEERHRDIEVSCLRDADIAIDDESEEISRYDFVRRSIELEHPDLVIIDGIADLIYNYNDVIESQLMVNNLATLANKHNCCIVVVMHQNKGSRDKNMKGHIGTMLYQKCSDVFQVEKHGTLFVVSHTVSRHRQCEELTFKLDESAVPMDAAAERQLQVEIENKQHESHLREMLADLVPEDGSPVKRREIVEGLVKNYGYKKFKCYDIVKNAIRQGWLEEIDSRLVKLKA